MKKKEIYLDYAATTPVDPAVLTLMDEINRSFYANPASIHKLGRLAKKKNEEARSDVAKILGATPKEIVFTGSGTEADNLALMGVAQANKHFGKHIIISAIEHKAVLESAKQLEKNGFVVSFATVDKNGILDLNKFKKMVKNDTILVSVMYANNEIGTIQPIRQISQILNRLKKKTGYPLFHTDACQAAGTLSLDVKNLGVDLLTFNGSKIYGPKGVGCLYIKNGVAIEPQIVGGGQEFNKRSGTENVALIAGMAMALKISTNMQKKENKRLQKLRDYFIYEVKKTISHAYLNGHPKERLPNNINFSFSGIEGESLVLLLDNDNIYCSTGSACSSLDLSPSHVLLAIGLTSELAHGSLRVTLGREIQKKDLTFVISRLKKSVDYLRKISTIKI